MTQRILLIDDENDFTELTGTLLRFHDFDVDTFNDPQDVEKAVQEKCYDLIVTDLMMPRIDGFQLIEKLRSMSSYAEVPIIALSAKTLTDAERKSLLKRQVSFLAKPFEPQAFAEHILKLLGG